MEMLWFFRRVYKRDRDRPDIRQASSMSPLVSEIRSLKYWCSPAFRKSRNLENLSVFLIFPVEGSISGDFLLTEDRATLYEERSGDAEGIGWVHGELQSRPSPEC